MNLTTPTPGWISIRMRHYGIPLVLSLLGIAITLEDGNASDEEINRHFDLLATEDDGVWVINQYYVALEEQHPFLSGFLGAITRWTEEPALHHYEHVREAAAVLRTIKWSAAEEKAGGDLLGSVCNDMQSVGARRASVFDFPDVNAQAIRFMMTQNPWALKSFMDAWCGSGTRVLGVIKAMRAAGRNTDELEWILNDPAPKSIAMAGLNMVGVGQTANVTLKCDQEWANLWAASHAGDTYSLRQLPPEIAEDVPGLQGKRLGQ